MSSHALAIALDDYLSLTAMPLNDRAVQALVRLREEAANEVDRLLALMDAIDGDPDLEPSFCGKIGVGGDEYAWNPHLDEAEPEGDELNLATTEAEDNLGMPFVSPHQASMIDECEIVCEDEGAQCDDEGNDCDTETVNEDGDILDQGEGGDDESSYVPNDRAGAREAEASSGFVAGYYSFCTSHRGRFHWCQRSERRSVPDGTEIECFTDKADAGDPAKAAFIMPLREFSQRAILWLRMV